MYVLPYLIFMRIHQAAIDARRRAKRWAYLAWSVLAGLVAGVLLAIGVMFFTLLWVVKLWWLAIPFGAFMVLPTLAPVLTRHVFVPLGWARIAYVGGMWSRPGDDGEAYGMCCAAWAFARKPTPKAEVWLAAKRDARIPLGDGEVVMTAFLAAGRGDAETARRLLRSIPLLVEDHPAVRDLAGEWLAVDAAERGAWSELHDDATHARWPATPLSFLLEGIAARHVGAAGAPSRVELELRWVFAPYRRATRALLADPIVAPAPPPVAEAALQPA